MQGLTYIGDVYLDKKIYAFRIRSSKNSKKSGSLWHCLKQRLDMGFKTSFAFKFRNHLVHSQGGSYLPAGLNQSMISGSAIVSPQKLSKQFS